MERGREIKSEALQERVASHEDVLTAYSYEKEIVPIEVDRTLGLPGGTPDTVLQPSNHALDEFTKILIGEAESYGVDEAVTKGFWNDALRYRTYMEDDCDHCELQREILAAIEELGHTVLDEDDTVLIWRKTEGPGALVPELKVLTAEQQGLAAAYADLAHQQESYTAFVDHRGHPVLQAQLEGLKERFQQATGEDVAPYAALCVIPAGALATKEL